MFTPFTFQQPQLITNGLVLYLDAADRTSYPGYGTTWRSLSGGNNGTLTNGPTYNSGNGGSIVFDGVDDTTNFGNILNIGLNSWTVSCWFKINSYSSGVQGILGKTSARGYVGRYTIFIENGSIYGLLQAESSPNYIVSTSVTPYNDSRWHNVTLSINRTGNMNFYLDSINVSSVNISSSSGVNLNASTDYLFVGSYANDTGITPTFFFNGNIASAQIYNRALSAAEVAQNFNAQRQRFNI